MTNILLKRVLKRGEDMFASIYPHTDAKLLGRPENDVLACPGVGYKNVLSQSHIEMG